MPFIQAGELQLHYEEYGHGDNVVVHIHGNLACINWMDLIWPQIPRDIHIFAIDWRGCGDSDKPLPTKDYANYSIEQHASDMLTAIKALGIKKCGLATHSTGGIISTYMLLKEPELFGRILALDPASPRGLKLAGDFVPYFQAMKDSRDFSFNALATIAPALFIKDTVGTDAVPQFRPETTKEQRDLYNFCVDKTRLLSDGVWFGTAYHLAKEREEGKLARLAPQVQHHHLVLWGEEDIIIPFADMEDMTKLLPNCRLQIIKNVGHAMNIENPDLYAQIFTEFFSA